MNAIKGLLFTAVPMLLSGVFGAQVQASHIGTCSTADVTVTSYQQFANVDGTLGPATIHDPGLEAGACAGPFSGNDNPKPSTNLGFAGDGLLNGATQQGPSGATLFPGGAFNSFYDQTDLNGDGILDPGWIMLGRTKNDQSEFEPEDVGGVEGIVLESFFSFEETSTGKGTWALTPDVDVVDRIQSLLPSQFQASFFEGFALLFKAGDGFAAYYFDLASLLIDPTTVGVGLLPYQFEGNFDVSNALRTGGQDGLKNPAEISHVSVWARDPVASITVSVSEPPVAWLFGLGTLLIIVLQTLRTRRFATCVVR